MHIAYVALAPFISGSERSLQTILLNCELVNIQPILITHLGSPLSSWAAEQGITYYSCDLNVPSITKPWKWLRTSWQLFRIFQRHKIEIVHSNQLWSYPSVAIVAKWLNILRVCHFRDPVDSNGNWWLKSKVDLAVGISRYTSTQLFDKIDSALIGQVETIINPVAIGSQLDVEERKSLQKAARNRFGLRADFFTFGFIGQIAEVKGLDLLIEALGAMKNKRWQLLVAGKDPSLEQVYLQKCKNLIEQHGLTNQVIFVGFLNETTEFYYSIDVVAMFSRAEPLGRVPLEAAACYCPTVATRVGGLPETIVDSSTGWLVDIEDKAGQVEVLENILNLNLRQFGSRAREWVESVADPIKYMQTIFVAYQRSLLRVKSKK